MARRTRRPFTSQPEAPRRFRLKPNRAGFLARAAWLAGLFSLSLLLASPPRAASGGAAARQATQAAAQAQEYPELLPGQIIEREFPGGTAHRYRFTLTAGQYARVEAEQLACDFGLAVYDPNGRGIIAVNRLDLARGPEFVELVAEISGTYVLNMFANDTGRPGRYRLSIAELRPATPEDLKRDTATKLRNVAYRLKDNFSPEAYRQAVRQNEEAAHLWQSIGAHLGEGDTLEAIGRIYFQARLYSLEEPLKALEYHQRALTVRRAAGDRYGEAETLFSLGDLYASVTGEVQRGFDCFQEALRLCREFGDRHYESHALNLLGEIYQSLGDDRQALDHYQQALDISRQLGDRFGEARRLENMAAVYRLQGAWQRALEHYQQALPGMGGWTERQSLIFTNIGQVYFSLGDFRQAREHYRRALELNRQAKNKRGEALALASIGEVDRALGEFEPAQESYTQALALNRAVGDSYAEADALAGLARVNADRGNFAEARAQIEAALNFFESARAKLISPDLRASYLATRQKDYEFYIALLMRMHEQQPQAGHAQTALHASERARARSLLDLLSLSKVDLRQGIDPALKERERDTQASLSRLQSQLIQASSQTPPDRQRLAQLEAALQQTENEREQIETEIRRQHPQYASLQYPTPLDLNATQQLLDDGAALLEYSLGADRSFLFVVTQTDFAAVRLPSASALLDRVRKLRSAIAVKPNRATLSSYRLQARALYQELIQPARKLLTGKRQLIIVPDGSLHYLPFEVLLSSGTASSELSRLPYLVRDYAISYAPSASVLASLRRSRETQPAPSKTFLAYADPAYGAQPPDAKSAAGLALRSTFGEGQPWRLQRLPYSREEATRIGQLFAAGEAQLFLGEQAREEMIKTGAALSQYRYLHFAVHGLLNENRPPYSGLVLSLPALNGSANLEQTEDGLLQVYEIFNLKLNADLVVLSACETGLGKQVKGEGLIGLTRAFLYAGSPSVAVSLWKVADASTSELMVRFYRRLKDDPNHKAEALRQAQLEMIKAGRFAHPFYWAPFVLVGQP